MDTIEELIQRVQKTQHGFTDIKKVADEVSTNNMATDSLCLAKELFTSEVHQARMLATFIFGHLAVQSSESLNFLKIRVSQDSNWRVQETLAQAFDNYCADIGYEQALPTLKEWLADSNPTSDAR